jgi:hypothetical protein
MSETPTQPLAPDSVSANRPATAVEQATHAAQNADDRAPMSEEQFLPTCMIWMMFIVLGLFIGAILIWVIANLPMALR